MPAKTIQPQLMGKREAGGFRGDDPRGAGGAFVSFRARLASMGEAYSAASHILAPALVAP
jgi:hypothetical protein